MTDSRSRIPSPARSHGGLQTPRRHPNTRKTRSVCSPRSTTSKRLSTLMHENRKRDKESFILSPLVKSTLADGTNIDGPGRSSWWKDLDDNSVDGIVVLQENKDIEPNNIMEDLDLDILSQEKRHHTSDLPESSDSESINSIILPDRRLFNEKEKGPQNQFKHFGTRDTLDKIHKGRVNIADKSRLALTKNRLETKSRLAYLAEALDVSTSTTASDKTVTAVIKPKRGIHNMFTNQQTTKRRDTFAKFIESDSEDEIQDISEKKLKFFDLQKSSSQRRPSVRSSTSKLRDPSPNSVTTDSFADWNQLPSSTMVENQLEAILTGEPKAKKSRLSKLSEANTTNSSYSLKKAIQTNNTISSKDKSKTEIYEKSDQQKTYIVAKNNSLSSQVDKLNKSLIKDKSLEHKTYIVSKNSSKTSQEEGKDTSKSVTKEKSFERKTNMNKERKENNQNKIKNDNEESREELNEGHKKQNESQDTENKIIKNENQEEHNKSKDIESSKVEIECKKKQNVSCEKETASQEIQNEKQEMENREIQMERHEVENKSQEVENERQTIQNVSVEKENESQEIQNERQEVENENQKKDNESPEVQNESHEGANKSRVIQNESQEAENNSQETQNISQEAENECREEDNESQEEANESRVIQNNSQEEHNESQEIQNESLEAENDSQEEHNESQAIQNASQEVENVSLDEDNESQEEDNDSREIQNESQEKQNESEEEDKKSLDENEEEDESQEEIGAEDISQEAMELDNTNIDGQETEHDDSEVEEQEGSTTPFESKNQINDDEADFDQNDNDSPIDKIDSANKSHDTTGRNRIKGNKKTLETGVFSNSNAHEASFMGRGRNTSVRNKTIIKPNIKPLEVSRENKKESLRLSDGTKDSSAEGSGWDSHRTTRKTLRQTFGKDFTPRKSLRVMVMEKTAKIHTLAKNSDAPSADSTDLGEPSIANNDIETQDDSMESVHEASFRTRQATLKEYFQKITKEMADKRTKMAAAVNNYLEQNVAEKRCNTFKVPARPKFSGPSIKKPLTNKKANKKSVRPSQCFDNLPEELVQDMNYRPPKRFCPRNAPWLTKHFYKYVETKLKPRYDYKARIRSEKFAEILYRFVQGLRRCEVASPDSVEDLKRMMARLNIVQTHFDFYNFFWDFMPRHVRIKVIPDIVNKIPKPRSGIYSDIQI